MSFFARDVFEVRLILHLCSISTHIFGEISRVLQFSRLKCTGRRVSRCQKSPGNFISGVFFSDVQPKSPGTSQKSRDSSKFAGILHFRLPEIQLKLSWSKMIILQIFAYPSSMFADLFRKYLRSFREKSLKRFKKPAIARFG